MRWAVRWGLLSLSLTTSALAQPRRDAGPSAPEMPSPRALVERLRGALPAVLSLPGRNPHVTVREAQRPLPELATGRCYALLGAAVGSAQVRARIMARGVTVVPETPLANSRGEALRVDFCVHHPAEWYALHLSADGVSQWHVELVDRGVTPAVTPTHAADAGPAPGDASFEVRVRPLPIGADDYVGAQIRTYARARPRLVGLAALARVSLATNQLWSARHALPAGRCVELVAAGVPSVRDLTLEIEDPAGHRVAQDGTHRATEAVRHCPRYAGVHTFRVRMFAGAGAVAAQVLIEP